MKTLNFTITHAFYNDTIHVFSRNKYSQNDDNFVTLCGHSYDNESVSITHIDNRPTTCNDCKRIYLSILLDN